MVLSTYQQGLREGSLGGYMRVYQAIQKGLLEIICKSTRGYTEVLLRDA